MKWVHKVIIEKLIKLYIESKITQIDGEIYHVHGSEESILYYPKQSVDSVQFFSSYQRYFSEN